MQTLLRGWPKWTCSDDTPKKKPFKKSGEQ